MPVLRRRGLSRIQVNYPVISEYWDLIGPRIFAEWGYRPGQKVKKPISAFSA